VKRSFTVVFGVSNKHSPKEYSFFADYDDVPLAVAVKRARAAHKASGAPYACLIRSNENRYHLYIPGFFSGEEIMRLHWFAKCDPWFTAFFLKHGRNVLRWTRKRKGEPGMKVAWESTVDSHREAPMELCMLLEELFGCQPPRGSYVARGSTEFSEYHMRPNGTKFYNKFLSAEGLNVRVKEVLGLE